MSAEGVGGRRGGRGEGRGARVVGRGGGRGRRAASGPIQGRARGGPRAHLVDDEGVGRDRGELIGAHQVDDIGLAHRGCRRAGDEANVEGAGGAPGGLEYRVAVPAVGEASRGESELRGQRGDCGAVGALQGPQTDEDGWLGCGLERGRKAALTSEQVRERIHRLAQVVDVEGEVGGGAHRGDWQPVVADELTQARVEQRRLDARIAPDQEQGVALLEASDRRVERVAGAQVR